MFRSRAHYVDVSAQTEQVRIAVADRHSLMLRSLELMLPAEGFALVGTAQTLTAAQELLRQEQPDVFLVDGSFGKRATANWVAAARTLEPATRLVVWDEPLEGPDTLRLRHAGVRGVLRKNVPLATLVQCLRAVSQGDTWPRAAQHTPPSWRAVFTTREREVLTRVWHGVPTERIAGELGISAGTVKIHVKHICQKAHTSVGASFA